MNIKPTYESYMEKYGLVPRDIRIEMVLNLMHLAGPEGGCEHCGWDLEIGSTAGKIEYGPQIATIDIISKCQRCQTEVHIKAKADSTGHLFNVKRSYKSPGLNYFISKLRTWWQSRRQIQS